MTLLSKNILNIFLGLIFGMLFVVASEVLNISHLNFVPFGGKSWALWIHPICLSAGLILSSKILNIKNKYIIFGASLIFYFLLFYFFYRQNLFINPFPFDINL